MKLNYQHTIVDDIIEECRRAPRKVASVELTKAERAELYRSMDTRFEKFEPEHRAYQEMMRGVRGFRGLIKVSPRFSLPVLAAEEQ